MPKVAVIRVIARQSDEFRPSSHIIESETFTELPEAGTLKKKWTEVESVKYTDYDAVLQFDRYNSEEEILEALEAALEGKIVGHWIASANGMNNAETREFRCWQKFFTYYDQLIPTVGE